jgi:hypothetical protein
MMADITITDLTDGSLDANNDWAGTGVFDKLIEAVNKNIEGQYNKGRISGSDYANVYLGSMQSVLAQSMQYLLQEKVVEADIALKEKQLEIAEQERLVLYVDRVLKDKQAAKLGMDNVSKQAEIARDGANDYIYSPYYEAQL